MYESKSRAGSDDVKKKKAERQRELTSLQQSLLTIGRKPGGQTHRKTPECFCTADAKVEVSRVGQRLQMWQAAGRVQQ